MVGRHCLPELDGTFYLTSQLFFIFQVIGSYEVTVDETGQPDLRQGRPQPDFESQEWKDLFFFFEDDPTTAISANSVMEALSQAVEQAGINTV